MTNSKPNAETGLSVHLAELEDVLQAPRDGRSSIIVRWWKPIDDPALVSLGGGIATVTVALIEQIQWDGAMLRVSSPLVPVSVEGHPIDTAPQALTEIPKDALLGLRVVKNTPVSTQAIQDMIGGLS